MAHLVVVYVVLIVLIVLIVLCCVVCVVGTVTSDPCFEIGILSSVNPSTLPLTFWFVFTIIARVLAIIVLEFNTIHHRWTFVQTPTGSRVGGLGSNVNFTFTPDFAGLYVLELIVSDGEFSAKSDNFYYCWLLKSIGHNEWYCLRRTFLFC